MSRIGKSCLFFSGLSLLVTGVSYLIFNFMHTAMYAGLGVTLLLFVAALFVDAKFYFELLTMRTTKHGMNMGALILLALVLFAAVNYMASKYDKRFDLSKDKWNSLSDQSVKAVKNLKEDVEIILLVKKDPQLEAVKQRIMELAQMYQNESGRVKFSVHNPRVSIDLAKKLDMGEKSVVLALLRGEKHVTVDQPSEEALTNAFLKLSTEARKMVYFVEGHGEKSITSNEPFGLSLVKEDMSAVYDTKTINLTAEPNVPDDAVALAIIGPKQQFLESELAAVRNFLRKGGSLFLAADPGESHNMARLMKTLGVEFQNQFVFDGRSRLPQEGPFGGIGLVYSATNAMTKPVKDGEPSIFPTASPLRKAPDASANLVIEEIVKTDAKVISVNEFSEKAAQTGQGPFVLAMSVKGKLSGGVESTVQELGKKAKPEKPVEASEENKEFSAVIFGDSDFLKNEYLGQFKNRTVAMNAMAVLSKNDQLVSIRPNAPKGTQIAWTRYGQMGLVLSLFALPVLLLISGSVVWWRRRTA